MGYGGWRARFHSAFFLAYFEPLLFFVNLFQPDGMSALHGGIVVYRARKGDQKTHLLENGDWAGPSLLTEKENIGVICLAGGAHTWDLLGRPAKSNQAYLWEPQLLQVSLNQHCIPLQRIRVAESTQNNCLPWLCHPQFPPLPDSNNFVTLSNRWEWRAIEVGALGLVTTIRSVPQLSLSPKVLHMPSGTAGHFTKKCSVRFLQEHSGSWKRRWENSRKQNK